MTEEARENILHPASGQGMGIAAKNVHDRVIGYFGPGSDMKVESQLGEGTRVTLLMKDGVSRQEAMAHELLQTGE